MTRIIASDESASDSRQRELELEVESCESVPFNDCRIGVTVEPVSAQAEVLKGVPQPLI